MFHHLRSVEQLGYRVEAMRRSNGGIYGISLIVQSSQYDPIYCQTKVIAFLEDLYHNILDEEKYMKYLAGTLGRKLAGFQSLKDEAEYTFKRMCSYHVQPRDCPDWDRKDLEIEILKSLNYKEIKMWWKKIFKPQERLPGDDLAGNLVNKESYDIYKELQRSNTKRKEENALGVNDTEEA